MQSPIKRPGAVDCLLLVLAAAWILLRFLFLEASPPGFYIDEAGGAGLIQCIKDRQSCFYEWNSFFPLYCSGPGGGMYPPTYLYPGALWRTVFGVSVQSLRMMAAFFSTLALLGLYLAADRLLGRSYARLAVLSGAVSPWAFHFSRIAWNPPLMPCGLIWGYYFFLRSSRARDAVLAGLCLSFAMYSYSPGMMQVALMVPLLFAARLYRREFSVKQFAVLGATGLAACLPLINYLLTDTGQSRFVQVSLLSPNYIQEYLNGSYGELLAQYLHHLSLYVDPRFLFIQGDKLPRHAVPGFGELSLLDFFGLLCFLPAVFKMRRLKQEGQAPEYPSRQALFTAFFSLAGIWCALTPAALTWDCQPHALRASGAWPFFALLSALLLHVVFTVWPRLKLAALAVVILFSGLFWRSYFRDYPPEAASWFDADNMERVEAVKNKSEQAQFVQLQEGSSAVFYLARYFGFDCESAQKYIWNATNNLLPELLEVPERSRKIGLSFSEVSRLKREGTPAGGPGVVRFAADERVDIAVPPGALKGALELSLDSNDMYAVYLSKGGTGLARFVAAMRPEAGGLTIHRFTVPQAVLAQGVDQVSIMSTYGDELLAVGHVVFYEADSPPDPAQQALEPQAGQSAVQVELRELSIIKEEKTPWEISGGVHFGPGTRVEVRVPPLSASKRLEISTDSNDIYRLVFLNGNEEVGELVVPEVHSVGGLVVQRFEVPQQALERGFDRLAITEIDGDDKLAVGHLVFFE